MVAAEFRHGVTMLSSGALMLAQPRTKQAWHPGCAMADVSAIISTYQRPDACERALVSALSQQPPPLEVLVCDDGSTDDTPERLRSWETRESRVRYLRVEPNRGTPGVTRNLGLRHAHGAWVAFLDDDDEWLPGKLRAQLDAAAGEDVVAGNAVTTDGRPYFPDAPPAWHPRREDLLLENPIVMSTVMARRDALRGAGGFLTARWARGVADYGMWLALADAERRFVILGQPLVRYESGEASRMSASPFRQEVSVARLAWRRAIRAPGRREVRRAALHWTAGALHVGRHVALAPAVRAYHALRS
jgi:glycosyltransferase involved in cell wall biosynthesis